MHHDLDALVAQLRALADEKYRIFNESLTPGIEGKSIGVRMPALRKIAKQLLREDPAGFLADTLKSEIHEINLLHATLLAKGNFTAPERIERLQKFVPTIGNWAVCDLLCNDLKPAGALKDALIPILASYAKSAREFEVRFACVMRMLWYRDEENIAETFHLYGEFHHDGYYARMGAAWGISYLYVEDPARTLALLRSSKLDDFTHNKAIRKCIESYRISEPDKQLLRTLMR